MAVDVTLQMMVAVVQHCLAMGGALHEINAGVILQMVSCLQRMFHLDECYCTYH